MGLKKALAHIVLVSLAIVLLYIFSYTALRLIVSEVFRYLYGEEAAIQVSQLWVNSKWFIYLASCTIPSFLYGISSKSAARGAAVSFVSVMLLPAPYLLSGLQSYIQVLVSWLPRIITATVAGAVGGLMSAPPRPGPRLPKVPPSSAPSPLVKALDMESGDVETIQPLQWAYKGASGAIVLDYGKWLEWVKSNNRFIVPQPLIDCDEGECYEYWKKYPCDKFVTQVNYTIMEMNERQFYMKVKRSSDGALFEFRDPVWYYLLLNTKQGMTLCDILNLYDDIVKKLGLLKLTQSSEDQYVRNEHAIISTEAKLIHIVKRR